MNLGAALSDVKRLNEALVFKEELFATTQRLYGPDDERTIDAEGGVATTLIRQGGDENLRRALETLKRTHAWKVNNWGREDRRTLFTLSKLAETYGQLGKFVEAEELYGDCLAARRRVLGEEHYQTLFTRMAVAQMIGLQGRVAEGLAELESVLPVASRVLGPRHELTRNIQYSLSLYRSRRGLNLNLI